MVRRGYLALFLVHSFRLGQGAQSLLEKLTLITSRLPATTTGDQLRLALPLGQVAC